MKLIIYTILLISITSCGFQAVVPTVEMSVSLNSLENTANVGEKIGFAVFKGSSCRSLKYTLKNDLNDYFLIKSNGEILLNKNNPIAGIYELLITGNCDKETREVLVNITINPRKLARPTILSPVEQSYVSSTSQTITGACEEDAIVNVGGNIISPPQTGVCVGNSYSIPVILTSPEGLKVINVSQTDSAGNISDLIDLRITLDTVVLAVVITSPSDASIVSATSQIITGTCETGASVNISGAFTSSPQSVLCVNAAYSTAVVLTSGDGVKNINAYQVDIAGNTSLTSSISLTLDTLAPNIIISSGESNPTYNSSFQVTLTFSEVIVGLLQSDIVISNGSSSNLSGSGAIYTVDITPTSNGSVSVDFAADRVQDIAGNNNTIATQYSTVFIATSPMISTWRVGAVGYGDGDNSITLPTRSGFNYNFTADWGDGSTSIITSATDLDRTHIYAAAGDYTITLSGVLEAWYFGGGGGNDSGKLLNVSDLGNTGWIDLSYAFYDCPNLTSVSGGVTNNVVNMDGMFSESLNIVALNLSTYDTSNVISMREMFAGAASLTSLDLSNFNTSNVISMRSMFSTTRELISLDLSSFSTVNVTDMSIMFREASKLTSLDLSSFDTVNVINMSYMFLDMYSLNSINLNSFNTSNVINMEYMFGEMDHLVSLDISHFNTVNVTNMSYMFYGLDRLASLDLSNFNTSQVRTMYSMFWGNFSLTSLNVSSFDTTMVTDMGLMFTGLYSLVSLDVSSFNTSNVESMIEMFAGLSGLTSLDVSNFATHNVIEMSGMFNGVRNIASLNVSNFNTSKVENMRYMFSGLWGLTSLDLSNFNTSLVEDMSGMFTNSNSLISLNLSNFDTSSVTNMEYMFSQTSDLLSLDATNWNISNVANNSNIWFLTNGALNLLCNQGGTAGTGDIFGKPCN